MTAVLTTNPILPATSPLGVGNRSSRRFSNRHPRHGRMAAVAAALLSLFLATAGWLSIVFDPGHHFGLHHFHAWDSLTMASPPPPPPRPPPSCSSSPPPPKPSTSFSNPEANPSSSAPLSLSHIVFGIAGSSNLWPRRREYIRLWWRPGVMRGHVWLDDYVRQPRNASTSLPPMRVSEDISRFRYTNPTGHPSGLRIARIILETFRLGHRGARWFMLCDDDTIVSPDNLVAVLSKYDWREMVYVGGPSESHSANTYFSHSMAFGGGGIAISYPLAEALAGMQDDCLDRYPKLYGSDDRLHACISELGVPLSREYGFHQWDIRGNALGILAAHPIAPFISVHHVEAVDPFYPGLSRLKSLKLFTKAMQEDPRSFLQRAICYNKVKEITFTVSLGYVVKVFPNIILPRELERSEVTYTAWNKISHRFEFDFDTADPIKSVCKKPILFFLKETVKDGIVTLSSYFRAQQGDDLKRKVFCFPHSPPLPDVNEIRITSIPLSENWHLVPRRLCCKIDQTVNGTLGLYVKQCERRKLGSVSDSLSP
ncbi:hypothetical protein AXF42_Ash021114 [Apostasia shenzhenica]|uniref:Beta-1,3-glucosyltransferase n=1 Tax=Apostasia shenzhenica TaxID=1088818 RepID=A0A2H9ZWX4_9ASPA|nr:hypothetical protein AXF42_Ash021114 [Apostasia shenzhenica]